VRVSLFVCDNCGCVENTAISLYWVRDVGEKALCSECDPKIKKWHNFFPKKKWDGKSEVINRKINPQI
jgi:hypothetical protein